MMMAVSMVWLCVYKGELLPPEEKAKEQGQLNGEGGGGVGTELKVLNGSKLGSNEENGGGINREKSNEEENLIDKPQKEKLLKSDLEKEESGG